MREDQVLLGDLLGDFWEVCKKEIREKAGCRLPGSSGACPLGIDFLMNFLMNLCHRLIFFWEKNLDDLLKF